MEQQGPVPAPPELAERIKTIRQHVRRGQTEQAKYLFSKLSSRWPDHPATLHARALIEWTDNQRDQARRTLIQALGRDPHNGLLVSDYADVLWYMGNEENALRLVTDFHLAHPTQVAPLHALINLNQRQNNAPAAVHYVQTLAQLNPTDVSSAFLIAQRELDIRRYDQAITQLEGASSQVADDISAYQNMLFARLYKGEDPMLIKRTAVRAAETAFGRVPAAKLTPPAVQRDASGSISVSERKIRIGYVSGDLFMHVVSSFFLSVLRAHDRSRFEVFLYSNTERVDPVTNQFRELVGGPAGFKSIVSLSDSAAADRIRADKIDVLVDLGGHTNSARLGVFAYRSAPVQATYLGYPATTGIRGMDYRITDAIADPAPPSPNATDEHYTEKVYRLPRCAWAFDPLAPMIPEETLENMGPAVFRNAEGVFTFGSFNLLTKVNHESIRLWAWVLRAVQEAGLKARILMTDRRGLLNDPESVAMLGREFEEAGADPTQVLLASWVPDTRAQVNRLNDVDVMLDPLSYNGTTTTCEALYNGVPVLTLPGNAHVSRVGASLMNAINLPEFVVESQEAFVERAVEIVRNPGFLRELRKTLRARFKACPLGDSAGLARALEKAYLDMLAEKSVQASR